MDWLEPIEQQAWIGLLACAAGVEYAADRQLQVDSSISFRTYSILSAVSESPARTIHMNELAGITGHSQSRLSHAITRLERDGLVTRGECPMDKRMVHVLLTDLGLDFVDRAAPGHVTAVRALIFDRLTTEQTAALADVTRTIWQSLVAGGQVPESSALGSAINS